MKFIVFNSFVIIGLFAIFTTCINPAKIKTKVAPEIFSTKKKGPGRIVFDKEIHNFGTLKEGEIISYSFRFRNSGDSPFNIVKVEKSCGCIGVNYSSNAIMPGDSSIVEIVFNSAGEWGNLIREATIETSDGEHKALKIGAYIDNKQFNNFLNTQK